ncbi:MAG: hypothetical protein ACLQPD_12315 [Desulfomonilaceae bacterium]
MAENTQDERRKIPLKKFLSDFRSPLEDRELMQRYGLSARSFVNLVTALMKKNLITKKDLDKRKEIAVQRDLAKESQFLSSLYICHNCSHPSPSPFEKCPACGADSSAPQAEEAYPPITTSEGHAYIPPTTAFDEVEVEEVTEKPNGRQSNNGGKSSAVNAVRSFFSRKGK